MCREVMNWHVEKKNLLVHSICKEPCVCCIAAKITKVPNVGCSARFSVLLQYTLSSEAAMSKFMLFAGFLLQLQSLKGLLS